MTRYQLSINKEDSNNQEISSVCNNLKSELIKLFNGKYWVSGSSLYTTYYVRGDSLFVNGKEDSLQLDKLGGPYSLENLQDRNSENRDELLQFLNVYIGSVLKQNNYSEQGRSGKFFDMHEDVMANRGLKVLSGFKIAAGVYGSGGVPKIMIDWVSRVTRADTLLDLYWDSEEKGDSFEQFLYSFQGDTFIHTLDKKLVKIISIDEEVRAYGPHPDPTYSSWIEYYKKVYNYKVEDEEQWMAYSLGNWKTKIVNGEPKRYKEKIYFLPECLKATGLTDSMRGDYRLMNSIACETKLSPMERQKRVAKMAVLLGQAKKDLGVSLDLHNTVYKAIQMEAPVIKTGDGDQVANKGNFFVTKYQDKKAKISDWVIVWEKDRKFMEEVLNNIKKTGRNIGIEVDNPILLKLPDSKRTPSDIKNICEKALDQSPKIILFIIDNFTASKGYSMIKKQCSSAEGVLTQIIKIDWKKIQKRGVFEKITSHMASKVGFVPWKVELPAPNKKNNCVMLIGADVYHKRGNESIAAVIGTLNHDFSKFCSFHSAQPIRGKEIMNNISNHVLGCVDAFFTKNKFLPKNIIFYRDGVGQGQLEEVKNIEITQILKGLKEKYGSEAPHLVFFVVTKRLNDRFFHEEKLGELQNPKNGLIVHSSGEGRDELDFFMVAQNVTQGTATPTRYQMIFNDSEIKDPSYYFKLTYFQTYNYFNWSGPVKVPSVCQYAHKLAYLVGETYRKKQTHDNLNLNLHFL